MNATPGSRANARGPIGVYDSGVGGISVLRALRQALPGEDFVYVADSGFAPYGDRDAAFLEARAKDIVGFLGGLGARAIVLACNTVSVAAAATLRETFHMPIVAMEPAIKPAVLATRSGSVLVLATPYTIRSQAVARLCERFGSGVTILLQAAPGLVEQVEKGAFSSPDTDALLRAYVEPGVRAGADTIVLGCTHYAFLAEAIARIAGPGVTIIEPSAAIARQLLRRLSGEAPHARAHGQAPVYFTSGEVRELRRFLDLVGEVASDVLALNMAADVLRRPGGSTAGEPPCRCTRP